MVCGIFFLETLAVVRYQHFDPSGAILITVFFLITLFRPFWGVFVFVAVIPFVNGYFLHSGSGYLTLSFNVVFFAWFTHYLFKKYNKQQVTAITFFACLLAVMVCLNLGLAISRMIPWPSISWYWLEWLSSFPVASQLDSLWQINAALIFLKGIVFYLMIEREIHDQKHWTLFTKTILIQIFIVISFAVWQVFYSERAGDDFIGLTLPFNDIHSFGSAVVLFLVITLMFFLGMLKRDQPEDDRVWYANKRICVFITTGLGVVILLCIAAYSASRMTWLTIALLFSFVLFRSVGKKKYVLYVAIFLLGILYVGKLNAPQLLTSESKAVYRLGTLLDVENILKDEALNVRYELWGRSLRMIAEFPLTGAGIGNVYRNIHLYKNQTARQWENENSHNNYLQMAAELGLPGLVLFTFLLGMVLLPTAYRHERKENGFITAIDVKPFRYGIGAYLLTMITGHPLLLLSQQLLFWSIIAIIAKGKWLLEDREKRLIRKKTHMILGVCCFMIYVTGFAINISRKEPWTIPRTYGFYSQENWDGVNMRWMSAESRYYFPAEKKNLTLKVVAQPFNSSKPDGLNVNIFINDSLADTLHFLEGGSKIVNFPLNSEGGNDIKVSFEVDRVFSPKKIGLNQDPRLLGVAIGELEARNISPILYILLR